MLPTLNALLRDVAPEHGRHAELVRLLEHVRDLDDLARGVVGAEVDGRADGTCSPCPSACLMVPHVICSALFGIGEQLVVVELHHERDLVRVLARDRAEHAEGAGDGVAAAFDRELHDVLGVEVLGVLRERSAGRVLDALIDREDRDVAGAGEATVAVHRLQAAQHLRAAIRKRRDLVDEIRRRQVKLFLLHRLRLMLEVVARLFTKVLLNRSEIAHGGSGFYQSESGLASLTDTEIFGRSLAQSMGGSPSRRNPCSALARRASGRRFQRVLRLALSTRGVERSRRAWRLPIRCGRSALCSRPQREASRKSRSGGAPLCSREHAGRHLEAMVQPRILTDREQAVAARLPSGRARRIRRAKTRAFTSAPAHMGHGSSVT